MTPKEAKKVLLAFANQFKDVPVISKYAFNGKQLQTLSEAIGVTFDDTGLRYDFATMRDAMSEYPVEEAEDVNN